MASHLLTGSNTSKLQSSSGNVGKSRRLAWFNAYANGGAGRWDALIPKADPSNNDDHYIMTDIHGTPTFTVIEIADRNTDVPFIWWDNAGKKLHCFSAHDSTYEAWTITYDDVGDSYSIAIGAAGNGVDVKNAGEPTPLSRGGSAYRDEGMGFVKTPNNRLWIFSGADLGNHLRFTYSDDDGATWADAKDLLTKSEKLCVDASYFIDSGITYVAVYASENGNGASGADFLKLDSTDASPETATWSSETANLPAYRVNRQGDDHCCIAVDSDENLYVAYKNEGTLNGNDEIQVIKRTPSGTWSGLYNVTAFADTRTRPQIAVKKIDGSNDEELIVVTGKTSTPRGAILYYTAPVATMVFTASSIAISNTGENFNEPMLWQSRFIADSTSGVSVIAHNESTSKIWGNSFPITAPATTAVTATGALVASPSLLSGVATAFSVVTATGSLNSGTATLTGASVASKTAQGVLLALASQLAGVATVSGNVSATGALSSEAGTMSGAASVVAPGLVTATGNLVSAAATLSGIADVIRNSSGALSSEVAALVGAAQVIKTITASGNLDASPAVLSGTATANTPQLVTAIGVLVSAVSNMGAAAAVIAPLPSTPSETAGSPKMDVNLGNVPQVEEPQVYEALLQVHSAIDTLAGVTDTVIQITADTTLEAEVKTVVIKPAAAQIQVTLPAAFTNTGNVIIFKVTNSGAGGAVLLPSSSEQIEGAGSLVIASGSSVSLLSDGTDWWQV